MGAMGHTKTIEMKIPQENMKECLKFAKTFELKLPIAGIVMSMKSRCEPKIVWVKSKGGYGKSRIIIELSEMDEDEVLSR